MGRSLCFRYDSQRRVMTRRYGKSPTEREEEPRSQVLYADDSPIDAPMFAFFPHSVGVANLLNFLGHLHADPA